MKKLFLLLTLLSCFAIGCQEKKPATPASTPPAAGADTAPATTPPAEEAAP